MFNVSPSQKSEVPGSNEKYMEQSKRIPISRLLNISCSKRENAILLLFSFKNLEAHTILSE
jgi:hypothetical protein